MISATQLVNGWALGESEEEEESVGVLRKINKIDRMKRRSLKENPNNTFIYINVNNSIN